MNLSLRMKLTLYYAAAILALVVVLGFSLNRFLTTRLNDEVDSNMYDYSVRVQEIGNSGQPPSRETYLHILESQAAANPATAPLFAGIIDTDGDILAVYPRTTQTSQLLTPLLPQSLSPNGDYATRRVSEGKKIRVYTRPLFNTSNKLVGAVEVGESLETVEQALMKLRTTLLVETIVGALVALLVGYVIALRGLRPVEDVIALTKNVTEKNLSQRLPNEKRPPELQRLADALNDMLDRVHRSFAEQRRFSADISHELRTPLTALRTQIEVLLMDPDLPDEFGPRLEQLERETVRLIELTSNLLTLSRIEAGALFDQQPVDLVAVIHEVYREGSILSNGVKLAITHEEPAQVMGDYSLLKQLMLNLVDNALKYTPAGGRVEIAIRHEGSSVLLQVSDTGIGIPKDALPYIFEPFYRVEKSRNRATGGAGLGLALAKKVAESHGGRLLVNSEEGRGTTAVVRMPRIARLGAPVPG